MHTRRTTLAGLGLAVALGMGLGGGVPAAAADDTINWKAVTLHRNGNSYNKWLWFKEEAARRTDGRLQVEIMTYPEIGLTGTDILRVMQSGLVSVGEVSTGYVSADFPLIEGTDLPGIVSDLDTSRTIYDAWTEAVVEPNAAKMGGIPYATFAWGTIHLMTTDPIEGVEDLEGKKIRVFAPAQARYIEEFGAEPISMPINDVYSALQRGVLDGMITGLNQIKPMSAWEITPYITDIGIAPLGAYIVISQRAWDALPEDIQAVLTDMQDEFTDVGWEMARREDSDGLAIAAENGMTVNIPASEALQADFSKAAAEVVVPWWVERVGPDGQKMFDEVVLPIASGAEG